MPTTTVRERPSRLRAGVLVAGELLITGGVVVLLFAAYLVVGTSWETASDQQAAGAELDRVWSAPAPASGPDAAPGGPPGSGAAVPPPRAQGEPLLRMYVPRFGSRWEFTVLEGHRARRVIVPAPAPGVGPVRGTCRRPRPVGRGSGPAPGGSACPGGRGRGRAAGRHARRGGCRDRWGRAGAGAD